MTKKTVSRQQIISSVANQTGYSVKETKEIVDCFIESVKESVKIVGQVNINGFGSFILKENKPTMFHPKQYRYSTYEMVYKPSIGMKKYLNNELSVQHDEVIEL